MGRWGLLFQEIFTIGKDFFSFPHNSKIDIEMTEGVPWEPTKILSLQ